MGGRGKAGNSGGGKAGSGGGGAPLSAMSKDQILARGLKAGDVIFMGNGSRKVEYLGEGKVNTYSKDTGGAWKLNAAGTGAAISKQMSDSLLQLLAEQETRKPTTMGSMGGGRSK